MKEPEFSFNEEKNILLKQSRSINFEDIIEAINKGKLIKVLKNPSKKYRNQGLLAVEIENYIYAVPYVHDKLKKIFFLKTVYPSRKLTKSYL